METLAVIISIIIMFLWLRTEANADRRSINAVQREDRKDILAMLSAIKDEMRDFHDRLCAIEERNRGK